uniref:Uncharacterized protein n=1 Tax=Picea glauca TaxID=3330 RepID=A0A124GNS3_PICGL|nr:hypothetical protein ABT39_MTgene2973 [Picea glauca]
MPNLYPLYLNLEFQLNRMETWHIITTSRKYYRYTQTPGSWYRGGSRPIDYLIHFYLCPLVRKNEIKRESYLICCFPLYVARGGVREVDQ